MSLTRKIFLRIAGINLLVPVCVAGLIVGSLFTEHDDDIIRQSETTKSLLH